MYKKLKSSATIEIVLFRFQYIYKPLPMHFAMLHLTQGDSGCTRQTGDTEPMLFLISIKGTSPICEEVGVVRDLLLSDNVE